MSDDDQGDHRGDEPAAHAAAGGGEARIIDRRLSPEGDALELVARGDHFDVLVDGKRAIASDARRSEQSLAELTMAPLGQRDDVTILVAGLGMGHTLRRMLDMPGVIRVDVVEISEAIVEWNRGPLAALNGGALADPRVHVHVGDLMSVLKRFRYEPLSEAEVKDGWLALILDVDDGPRSPSRPQNLTIYTEEGIERLESALRPGGVLAVWSAERDLDFLRRIHARFVHVAELAVPVDVEGKSSLDYVYRARRAPRGPGAAKKMAQA